MNRPRRRPSPIPVHPIGEHLPGHSMKLAVVVQRYGAEINGGAELHARYIAERLARHADVRVLTTCAEDYVTWRNSRPSGVTEINGVVVERFPVERERDVAEFGRRSLRVFDEVHSIEDELRWLDSEGPLSRQLIERVRNSGRDFDFLLVFTARYYHAFHAARALPDRSILVPTAEREPSIGLEIFQPIFRGVRAIMYNSFEERAAIRALSGNDHVPGVVVGVGSEVPERVAPERPRGRFGLRSPYVVYVGRIDTNKGCVELFDYFAHYLERSGRDLDLVLIGNAIMPVPAHPRIRHLGFVSDADKFDVIAGSRLLIMPSYFESLSMVALEAWALGKPVLANAACDVLVGQCVRSNAGLYYQDSQEFSAALDLMLDDGPLAAALGENGRAFFARHYAWPVIERKYLDMLERLASDPPSHVMEPLPGWFARRARAIPPSADVVKALPSGPILQPDPSKRTDGWLPQTLSPGTQRRSSQESTA
jgi:glycosyltransferase involved in cell wall biosynthesis